MLWLYGVLLLLSPAILYRAALALAAAAVAEDTPACPACGQPGLKCVNFIMATVLVDGRRTPDSWSYYVCERCGAAHKLHRGDWESVPEGERHHLGGSA